MIVGVLPKAAFRPPLHRAEKETPADDRSVAGGDVRIARKMREKKVHNAMVEPPESPPHPIKVAVR